MKDMSTTTSELQIVSDCQEIHPATSEGERIVRTQIIRDNRTGSETTINFWANLTNGKYTTITIGGFNPGSAKAGTR